MREIKFRGYCDKDSEWRTGCYVTDGKAHEILTRLKDGEMYASQVDSESIGQYTGLKDSNGVEAYFGDIAKAKLVDYQTGKLIGELIGEIVFSEHEIALEMPDDSFPLASWILVERFEVIGNIHQNPELLES